MAPTEATNLLGAASYLAEIGPNTDIVDLASDIVATLRADLANGVIQQSGLHFGTAFEGTPPGLPPLVFCTDATSFPTMRTPPGLEIEDIKGQFYCSISVPLDLYSCAVYAGQLIIEHHGHIAEPGKSLEAIRSLLCTVPRSMAGSWSDLTNQPADRASARSRTRVPNRSSYPPQLRSRLTSLTPQLTS